MTLRKSRQKQAQQLRSQEQPTCGLFDYVSIYLTERCNLRCAHCFMGSRLEAPKEFSDQGIWDALQYFRVLGATRLTLTGGEPTLYGKLPEVIRKAASLGYRVTVNSNGSFSPDWLHQVDPGWLEYLSISVDGACAKTHDRVRGSGSFADCTANIERAVSQGFRVRIISTLSDMNLGEGLDIIRLADELCIDLVNFHIFVPQGQGRVHTDWQVAPADWVEFCCELEETSHRFRASIRYPPAYATVDTLPHFIQRGYQGCLGRQMNMCSLFPNGEVYICAIMFDAKNNFASYRGNCLAIEHGNRSELEMFTEIPQKCLDCSLLSACRGGCAAQRELLGMHTCAGEDGYIPMCILWKVHTL